jgi:hypothetical protein
VNDFKNSVKTNFIIQVTGNIAQIMCEKECKQNLGVEMSWEMTTWKVKDR